MLRTARRRLSRELGLLETGRAASFVGQAPFQIDEELIERSRQATAGALDSVTTATWFVPYFTHAAYAGVFTVLRVAEHLAKEGVRSTFVIYGQAPRRVESLSAEARRTFPGLAESAFRSFDFAHGSVEDLPPSDIAFSTLWDSAYLLLRFNQCKRKFYLIQDYEPLFFPAGAKYALAEATYRFGFTAIANTPGLLEVVRQRHQGVVGTSFVPPIDRRYFHDGDPGGRRAGSGDRCKVVCYTRPTKPRNAFELMLGVIRELSSRVGPDAIEIITAGEQWSPKRFGVQGLVTNLGLLKTLDEVGALYRSCDIGIVYMLSAHPSYQPFEFMASGVATVVNRNQANAWFLRDRANCLVAEPSPPSMAAKVAELVMDSDLRERIQQGGREAVTYDWPPVLDEIWAYIAADGSRTRSVDGRVGAP